VFGKAVVPLDGSELAELALPFAQEMAARLGTEVVLLCVSESAEAEEYARHQIYLEQVTAVAQRAASRLLGGIQRPVNIHSAVQVGLAAQEIVDFAARNNADLIIMATHGRTGVTRWALGSVAEKVMRAGTTPVLLVRVPGASNI